MYTRLTTSIKSFFGAGTMSFSQYFKNMAIRFKEDSLFQNSVFLMMSTISMSVFGFIFWIISTRLYTTEQIGFATALISTTVLLSTFSMFGFNTGIIRYLPKSEKPNNVINTAIVVVTGITIIISAAYVLGIGYIAPQFSLLKEIPLYGILFVVFMIIVSMNMLTDSIFIAYRASKYNFLGYAYFGITKILLPIFLIALGTYGIFLGYTGSVIVALIVTFYFMVRKFSYRPNLVVKKEVVKTITTFSLRNYVANFIVGLPLLVLPTIIVTKIGPDQSAYFYIASTIAALLYGIPYAVALSLLAEGSHNEKDLTSFVKSASKLIGVILVCGVTLFIAFGKYVLLIFGTNYAQNSKTLLVIMAITSFFVAINSISTAVLRVRNQTSTLVLITIGYLIVTMSLIFISLNRGIIGIGWALFFGQVFMSLEFLFLFMFQRKPSPELPELTQ
jgi:O-antigen/teichoic acid export membrane protein